MKYETKKIDKIIIVYPPQMLDMKIYDEFSGELNKLIKKEKDKNFLFNFGQVKHVNSLYLSFLVKIMKELQSTERKLKFCSVQPAVKNIFKVADLLSIFEIHEEEEEALNSFNVCAVA
ncbi:MAG TPA: STAS domain-containing protein [Spirochaetota bacterium]|nr:STAS domain-containing protein [Spirochaetota bacterium]HRZ25914.1 STAS domain-containing protein [Spirochaetota bacterium]HSA14076.1 STAS domain-containing protein [Spirochaetota bacterium]